MSSKVQQLIKDMDKLHILAKILLNDSRYSDVFTPATRIQFQTACKQYNSILGIVHRLETWGKFRPTPFHIQLFGPPGVGKSTLFSRLTSDIQKQWFSDVPDNSLVYTRGNTDHFDGYHGQPIMMQDGGGR